MAKWSEFLNVVELLAYEAAELHRKHPFGLSNFLDGRRINSIHTVPWYLGTIVVL